MANLPEWFPLLVDLPIGKVLVLGGASKPAIQQLYREVKRLVRQAQRDGLFPDCVITIGIKANVNGRWVLTIKKEAIAEPQIISIEQERRFR